MGNTDSSTGSSDHVSYVSPVPSDIEVSQSVVPLDIEIVAANAGVLPAELEKYGSAKAKVRLSLLERLKDEPEGLYVVTTGITPTPLGEGKSTTTVGLTQSIGSELGLRTFACIRQPSQGPTFGVKGGAAGGGYSQVVPMEEFNLHLTGDIHAITAANNLVAAALDTRMFHEKTQSDVALFDRLCPINNKTQKRKFAAVHLVRLEKLGIAERQDPEKLTTEERVSFARLDVDESTITWKRVVDTCDRHLRGITVGQAKTEAKGGSRATGFDISVASEIMAVLALTTSAQDMRARFGRMVVATSTRGEPVTCDDLGVAGAVAVLMREAIKPTLMQTIERTPVFVHAGPFANIAHGNSSIVADKMALKLVGKDGVVVTEAGFGADIGAEKFFDIKCRVSGLVPHVAVIVATVRALKSHGGGPPVAPGKPLAREYVEEDVDMLVRGCSNLVRHVENLKKFNVGVVVAINRFATDTDAEISALRDVALNAGGADAAVMTNHWELGGSGAVDLARATVAVASRTRSMKSDFRMLYELDLSLKAKIEGICTQIYRAGSVAYSETAEKQLALYESRGWGKLAVCIAKTHLSFSADPKLKGAPEGFEITVREASASVGAGFVFVKLGNIMTIPGLPTLPGFVNVDLDFASDPVEGKIVGLF